MIKLSDILNEIVNDSLLYHNTSMENLLGIIESNFTLIPGFDDGDEDGYVSFSRYKDMPDQEHDPEFEVKITVDKNKLKYKYKIEPYADLTVDDGESDEYSLYSKQSMWFQAEERIKGPVDIKRAIVNISLPNEDEWVEEEGQYVVTHYKGSTTRKLRKPNEPISKSILVMYKNITTLLKKNNIPYTIR
jgi:hypothetical protein